MREQILRNTIRRLCDDFADSIIIGVKESEEKFPFTVACINFMCELKENGKRVNLNLLAGCPEIFDSMYRELINYLIR